MTSALTTIAKAKARPSCLICPASLIIVSAQGEPEFWLSTALLKGDLRFNELLRTLTLAWVCWRLFRLISFSRIQTH